MNSKTNQAGQQCIETLIMNNSLHILFAIMQGTGPLKFVILIHAYCCSNIKDILKMKC